MWIKICANTSFEDAQAAVNLGAHAVGFVFAPSSRRVSPEEVGAITARITGGAETIGVFPDWEFEAVRSAVRVAGLTGVQMHGGYRPDLLRRLREEFGDAVTIAQTLHWEMSEAEKKPAGAGERAVSGNKAAVKDEAEIPVAQVLLGQVKEIVEDGLVDRVLVDSKVGAALGGTGQVFDWNAAETLFRHAGTARLIVAGGLKAENVREAIGRLQPWGVDVASGVEVGPGKKDPERLRLFLERAQAAAE